LDDVAQLFECCEIIHGCGSVRNLGQDVMHLGCADAAWNTFAARFAFAEVHEIFRNVDHA